MHFLPRVHWYKGYYLTKILIDLAAKDLKEFQQFILSSLLNTPHIQKIIIIKALLNEVFGSIPERRHSCLAALNRMHTLVNEDETLEKLRAFFHDPKIDKIFIARLKINKAY